MPEKMPKQSDVHIQIEDPLALRKQILNTAINTAEILKHNEAIKEIHHRKRQYQKRLKDVFSEIEELKNNLERDLPKIREEKEQPPPEYKPQPVTAKREIKAKVKKQRTPHKAPLDREIDNIRRKLESL